MTVWSGDMETIADIYGDEIAQEIHDRFPGLRFYVPQKVSENGAMAALSEQAAAALIEQFGGGHIYVQSKRRSFEDTYRLIEELVDQGLPTRDIALKLGITQAYVFQVRSKAGAPKISSKPDPRQRSLFD